MPISTAQLQDTGLARQVVVLWQVVIRFNGQFHKRIMIMLANVLITKGEPAPAPALGQPKSLRALTNVLQLVVSVPGWSTWLLLLQFATHFINRRCEFINVFRRNNPVSVSNYVGLY